MKILAIDTATLAGGAALMDEERLIAEYRLDVAVRHSERIMVAIDHLLKESHTKLSDLDAIAVSIGPGSFTGLRVGLATAKGLATGAGRPLVLVPTLAAMAHPFSHSKYLIAPWINARRGEVYWSLFENQDNHLVQYTQDAATSPEDAIKEIGDVMREQKTRFSGILFVGDGALKYRSIIQKKLEAKAAFPTLSLQFPSAASVAELGLELLTKGEGMAPDLAVPSYLRASYAELKRNASEGKMRV